MDNQKDMQNTQYSLEQNEEIQKGLEQGLDVSVYANPEYNPHQMNQLRRGLQNGLDVSVYADPKYSSNQMMEIRRGLEDNVDVSVYANPEYDWEQMDTLREGLWRGLDVSVYADPKYDFNQMNQLYLGLKNGVDISVYANPEYSWGKMEQLRFGLEEGLDVSVYASPEYNWKQMEQLREGLKSDVDISIYADPKYTYNQMRQLRIGLENSVDVSVYANPKYDVHQMSLLRKGLEEGLDISVYADPQYNRDQMAELRWGLKNGVDVSVYANPEYSEKQMRQLRKDLEQKSPAQTQDMQKDVTNKEDTINPIQQMYNKKKDELDCAKQDKIEWADRVTVYTPESYEPELEQAMDAIYQALIECPKDSIFSQDQELEWRIKEFIESYATVKEVGPAYEYFDDLSGVMHIDTLDECNVKCDEFKYALREFFDERNIIDSRISDPLSNQDMTFLIKNATDLITKYMETDCHEANALFADLYDARHLDKETGQLAEALSNPNEASYNVKQSKQAWNPGREELFESIAAEAVEKFETLDAGDRGTLISLHQEQFNNYLKKLAINEVLNFDHMQPVEDAITAIVEKIDLDGTYNNGSDDYGVYDVNITQKNDQGIPTSFEISFDNWEAADEDHREWSVSFDLTEDTVKAITEAKKSYEYDMEYEIDDPYLTARSEIEGAIFEQIDIYNETNRDYNGRDVNPEEVIQAASEYLMGSEQIPIIFPGEEIHRLKQMDEEYLCSPENLPSREAARSAAWDILYAYDYANNDRHIWVTDPDVGKLATSLAKIQDILEHSGYDFETKIDHTHQTASMIIEPKHQYSDATFQISVKDIDLTGQTLQAKGQLTINNEVVTPETIDEIRKTHDKIITRTEQIMKMVNSPEHDKEMLQVQDISKSI